VHLRAAVPCVREGDPWPPPGVHAAAWALEVAGLGRSRLSAVPVPPADPGDWDEAGALLSRLGEGFLALHPGSGAPQKNWPSDRFRRLARHLAGPERWLVVEGPADTQPVAELATERGAVVARGLRLRALGALLSRAGLYVGHDSGVTHLAAAWGAPTLALFGPTDPVSWAPLGPRVRVLRSPTCRMADLGVRVVAELAAAFRGGASG
jgi:ADP-heptose:LPS heptosyltransferase